MKTLLIVEDEKMIRQGIHVMAGRSKVEIQEILECRNGEEALKVLKSRKIDVMFTDIRMPKMNGIDLVREAKRLEEIPKIVVLSGYDEFDYAVEMLKHGVEDYLLKPIKREKIEELLEKLEKQLQKEENDRGAEAYLLGKQLLNYLKKTPGPEEEKLMAYKFRQAVGDRQYCVAMYGDTQKACCQEGFLQMVEDGQVLQILGSDGEKAVKRAGIGAGISSFYSSFSECRKAYREAAAARGHAWIHHLPYCQEAGWKDQGKEVDKEFVSQFVLKLSTENWEEGIRQYQNLFFAAEHGQLREAQFVSQVVGMKEKLEQAYGNLFPEQEPDLMKNPLSWGSAEEYMQSFVSLVREIRNRLIEKYDNNRNQNKIRTAVQYVEENYKKDLNMAMVSNYVSVNYSLFSILFKEYTGVNFVTYLKNLRIEEAKRLLRETDEKVRDIGKTAGFENDKNFLKSFKAACGVSPTEYRRMTEWKESMEESKKKSQQEIEKR